MDCVLSAAELAGRAIRRSEFAEVILAADETYRVRSLPDGSVVDEFSINARALVKALAGGIWRRFSLPARSLGDLTRDLRAASPSRSALETLAPAMAWDGGGSAKGPPRPEEDADLLWEVADVLRREADSFAASCTCRRLRVLNSLGLDVEFWEAETAVVAFWHRPDDWFQPADEEVVGGPGTPRDLGRLADDLEGRLRRRREESARWGSLSRERAPRDVPIVLHPEAAAVLVHELVQHGVEGDEVSAGRSYLSGRLGARVAAEVLSVREDPAISPSLRSLGADHEGVSSREVDLIVEGRLKSYLTDVESSLRMGHPPTGSARASGEEPPSPRASGLAVQPGDWRLDELADIAPRVALVRRISGGAVSTESGSFRLSAPAIAILHRGEEVGAVRGAWLSGSCLTALRAVRALGRSAETTHALCIKGRGLVLAAISCPAVALDGGSVSLAEV